MSRRVDYKSIAGLFLVLALVGGLLVELAQMQPTTTQTHGAGPALQYRSYAAFVAYTAAHHQAPFYSKRLATPQQFQAFAQRQLGSAQPFSDTGKNVRVNQDRNPWPKLEIGAAISPFNGHNYVVTTNDFREGTNHIFYHVSTNGGQGWTDDALTNGTDAATGSPYNFQSDPGIAFDRAGHSFISNVAGNLITDASTGYTNLDNEIDVTTGFANGTYTNITTTPVDYTPCNGNAFTGSIYCPGQFDKALITVDNVPGSPHQGAIYVYYTYFCNGVASSSTQTGGTSSTSNGLGACRDGNAVIPPFDSAVLVSHADGAGKPFSPANLVSGTLTQTQFADMVIDSHGKQHIFFDDYASYPTINMYESSFTDGSWKVSHTPVVSFQYNGLNNSNWQFQDTGTVAPGCSIYKSTAYCAFSASQIGTGAISVTPSVYVVVVDTAAAAIQVHRVNNDPLNDTKDHFFPWASTAPNGAVYVGWYDNRNDPFNTRVQYFVGKSTNGGKTFPKQQAVSDALFNPCLAFPSCASFGNYTQLVTGPDGITHATWSDTRDGASAQIYTQALHW